jgi:hypothetical protein
LVIFRFHKYIITDAPLHFAGPTCRNRWTKLRDNHRRALQLRKSKTGEAAIKMRPPKFNKELSFLIPYLQEDENRKSNVSSDTEELSSSVPNAYVSRSPSPEHGIHGCRSLVGNSRKSKYRNPGVNSPNTSYLEERSRECTVSTYSDIDQDPLIGFFANMGRTVKGFPHEEQIRIKSELFSIVNSTEMRLAVQSSAERMEITNTSVKAEHLNE